MSIDVSRWTRTALAALFGLGMQATALAAPIDVLYIGTWSTAPGSGNTPSPPGPGMATGQRYVVKITYDDTSAVSTANILTEGFGDSGQDMSTINLSAAGNSLEVLVPMEGFGTIYTQTDGNHLPFFIPNPTLNFVDGSNISDTSNIIGVEFEGDFASAGLNFIEMFNTAANAASPINSVSQIMQCPDVACAASATAIRAINTLADAVDVVADAGADIVYSAAMLSATATSTTTQNNDLGAFRTDGEDFIDDASWTESGGALVGAQTGDDILVAIANSGLVNTIDTVNWQVEFTEQLTDLSGTDTTIVSYANANPSLAASTTVQVTGIDFAQVITDADLAVNALIANFEILTEMALDGGSDVSAFFADLFNFGSQSSTYAELEAAFGLGLQTIDFKVTDLAGAMSLVSLTFDVLDTGPGPGGVPVPATLLLIITGLLGMGAARTRRRLQQHS